MRRGLIPVVGAVIVLLGLGVWIALNFERVTERVEVGFQGEARRNPLLAAMRLYQRMGVPAREARQLVDLGKLPSDATMILGNHRVGMSQQRVRDLLAWVEAGGHVIVEAEYYKDKDALLDELNVQRSEIRTRGKHPPSEVLLPHAPATLLVHLGYRQTLQPRDPTAYRFDDASGTHLVHIRRGRGAVTILTDMDFMDNAQIVQNDHAEFAWQLVRFMPQTREVVVVPWFEMPSLSRWLFEHAAAALGIAALLLAAWIWRIVPRFGPLEPDPLPARRRLLDHLRASARFHWKRHGAGRLLEAAREACTRRISRSHPLLADLPRQERVEKLAALTHISAGQLDMALYGEAPDALQFTHAVSVLQSIEDRLVRKLEG